MIIFAGFMSPFSVDSFTWMEQATLFEAAEKGYN